MGSGLYEAAFAALVRLYGHGSRDAITGITLIAGFASTLGWPLSTLMEHEVSWRGACYTWGWTAYSDWAAALRQSSSANRVRRRPVPARCSYACLPYGRYSLGSGAVADSACTMMPVTRQPPASLIA
jgi:hypothetical protein